MSPFRASCLAVLAGIGCGGTVIIEGGAGGASADGEPPWWNDSSSDDDAAAAGPSGSGVSSGGSGAADSSGSSASGAGSDAWGPIPPGDCLTCPSWFEACGDGGLCPHPDAVCEPQVHIVQDLILCVCSGCADVCGGSCAMFDQTPGSACGNCQKLVLQEPCQYERFACVGSPFP